MTPMTPEERAVWEKVIRVLEEQRAAEYTSGMCFIVDKLEYSMIYPTAVTHTMLRRIKEALRRKEQRTGKAQSYLYPQRGKYAIDQRIAWIKKLLKRNETAH